MSHSGDPIEELKDRIEEARRVDEPISIPGDESFDPLARLRLRLAQGHPAANQEPLLSLYDDLSGGQSLPPTMPYEPSDDPMESLRQLASGEMPEVEETLAPATQVEEPTQDYSAIESILGREVLALAGSSALSSESRKEALSRVAIALENPSRENVRAILLALLRD